MVWNLEDNSDTYKERKIYGYVRKQSGNSKFARTIERFLNLYEYLKGRKYESPDEMRQDILSNGKPLFKPREAERVFELTAKKGGAQYPFIDNISRALLEWVYKWSPGTVGVLVDFYIPKIRHYSAIFITPELREVYDMTTQLVSVIIRENVVAFQQTSEETGFFAGLGQYVMSIIISIFIVLVNIINVTNDDFGSVFVDTFLIVPVLGPALYTLAVKAEPQLSSFSQQRDELVQLMRTEYKDEEAAVFLDKFLPDIADAQKLSQSLPGPFEINPTNTIENLYKARDIFMKVLQNPENAQKVKEKLSAYARSLEPSYTLEANKLSLQMLGSKYPARAPAPPPVSLPAPVQQFNGGRRTRRKWGTQRKSEM